MFQFFRRHRTVVLVSLTFVMIALLLFGVGGTSFMSSPHDTIVKVNGTKVSQVQFDRVYNQLLRQNQGGSTPQERQQMMQQALNELIRQEVYYQESKKYGLRVPDQELQAQIASIPLFQREGQFNPMVYRQAVAQVMGISANEFEKGFRKDLAGRKLNQLIMTTVQVPEREFQQELQARLAAEKDSKKRKELQDKPRIVKNELRDRELNLVFSDWLAQVNSRLKVDVVSEPFRQRMNNAAQ